MLIKLSPLNVYNVKGNRNKLCRPRLQKKTNKIITKKSEILYSVRIAENKKNLFVESPSRNSEALYALLLRV